MLTNYAECERRVLLSEGGYTNNPRDPGGPTNRGITLRDARAYWKPDATADDVRNMPLSVAQEIFKTKYWNAVDGDDLPSGVDYTVFDYAINSGVTRAKRVLYAVTGARGDMTEALRLLQSINHKDVVDAINRERLEFLRHLSTWDEFGAGWTRRVVAVDAYSDHLAMQAPGIAPPHPENPDVTGKAYSDDPTIFTLPAWLRKPRSSQSEAPATDVAPAPEAIPGLSKSKPWVAWGLGGIGSLEWFHRLDDYMQVISDARLNLQSLDLTSVAHWLYANPFFLLPPLIIGIAVWLWQDHKRTKLLLQALQRQQSRVPQQSNPLPS